jgi:diaminopimelate epimerase
MMQLPFYKYQGTGNDFIMIDNRTLGLPKENTEVVKRLCDRRFGIGGDGLIYLQNKEGYDFEMVYFNSDGRESTMCGNGGRCIVRFAHDLGLGDSEFTFLAIDGPHRGRIKADGTVSLQMLDVKTTFHHGEDYVLNTGSPHFVHFVKNVKEFPVASEGRNIRYSDTYQKDGINVNFVEAISKNSIFVRTYERGVEDETLSCGTGVVASSIAFYYHNNLNASDIQVETLGGRLNVTFAMQDRHFTDIWLSGPAVQVFSGETTI